MSPNSSRRPSFSRGGARTRSPPRLGNYAIRPRGGTNSPETNRGRELFPEKVGAAQVNRRREDYRPGRDAQLRRPLSEDNLRQPRVDGKDRVTKRFKGVPFHPKYARAFLDDISSSQYILYLDERTKKLYKVFKTEDIRSHMDIHRPRVKGEVEETSPWITLDDISRAIRFMEEVIHPSSRKVDPELVRRAYTWLTYNWSVHKQPPSESAEVGDPLVLLKGLIAGLKPDDMINKMFATNCDGSGDRHAPADDLCAFLIDIYLQRKFFTDIPGARFKNNLSEFDSSAGWMKELRSILNKSIESGELTHQFADVHLSNRIQALVSLERVIRFDVGLLPFNVWFALGGMSLERLTESHLATVLYQYLIWRVIYEPGKRKEQRMEWIAPVRMDHCSDDEQVWTFAYKLGMMVQEAAEATDKKPMTELTENRVTYVFSTLKEHHVFPPPPREPVSGEPMEE